MDVTNLVANLMYPNVRKEVLGILRVFYASLTIYSTILLIKVLFGSRQPL